MHTTCSDGAYPYEEMVQSALEEHLDFIAITDHSENGWGPFSKRSGGRQSICNEVIKQCQDETRLVCFPGTELSGRVHILALGIREYVDETLSVKAQVEEIHRQGGLAIAAHPSGSPVELRYSVSELTQSGFDATEGCGSYIEGQSIRDLAEQYNIPCVLNSDAHDQLDVGGFHNNCTVPIKSLADLKAALIGNKCVGGQ